jgi:hypothetical protein
MIASEADHKRAGRKAVAPSTVEQQRDGHAQEDRTEEDQNRGLRGVAWASLVDERRTPRLVP